MNRFVVISFSPKVALDEIPTSSRLAVFAAVATPAGIKGQKNRIADLNGFIAHLVANATHDTRSLVAKDGWIVADVSEESLLQQDILSQFPDQPGLFLLEYGKRGRRTV
jgi:hypothetical protein